MLDKSLKINSVLNLFHKVINVIFPLISFPYASRILLPEGIGIVSFAQGYVNYFVLIAGLGVPIYGVRMVAKYRDNKELLSQKVIELMLLLVISALIFIFFYYGSLNYIPTMSKEKSLFFLLGLIIPFSILGVEWFYQGIEEYRFITLRSIFFKVLSLVLLFTFVKDTEDYIIYAGITVVTLVGNNLVNFINLRHYLSFNIKQMSIKEHIKPLFLAFTFILATSVYVNLDTVMLGFLSNAEAVGLYSASIGIIKSVVIVITSMGVVFIPRISYYIEKQEYAKVHLLAQTSYRILMLFGIPAVFGLLFLADKIMLLFAGNDFINATPSMRIMIPVIVFLGISNLIGLQVLYPYGQEKLVLKSVFIGAIVNVSLNFILIPKYGHIGAALGSLFAEMSVALIQIWFVKPYVKLKYLDINIFKYLIGSLAMLSVLYVINRISMNSNIFVYIIIGIVVYFLTLIILKDELFLENVVLKVNKLTKNRIKGRD